ncbi:MAG: GntR family transcriptional regulator [Proteobacteria bacterium]|nr:GntR family transcriptional regulator [Pseudomonadota bacterium]
MPWQYLTGDQIVLATAAAGYELDPKQPIGAQVHSLLKKMIIGLAFMPNEALSEKELALRLGVSRTPVREALIRLADETLVDVFPQRGTFVSPIKVADVMEAHLREAREAAVARRARSDGRPVCLSAPEDLHQPHRYSRACLPDRRPETP